MSLGPFVAVVVALERWICLERLLDLAEAFVHRVRLVAYSMLDLAFASLAIEARQRLHSAD